ncbi:MAG: helix-turn-helix transcriptional regulator [Bacteroidota bacterium]|nr:helix-turn-helix transcriptional regulator [Bacteroidota bacterium]
MTNSYNESDQALLNNLGQRIRELRTKSDLSQEKLAFTCDLDRTYIGSVERGERNVSIINLQKIATALNVELHELLNF